jgi:MEMO1 family protein
VSRPGLAVREPAVAGSFYDAGAQRLTADVDRLLDRARPPEVSACPTALVAPHAGYAYSGPVAATAYATLRPHAEGLRRVVLLGPPHFVPVPGMAVPAATGFATPLGVVDVEVTGCVRVAAEVEGVEVSDRPHEQEHALEVQLPFLQRLLPEGFTLLPVVVGGAAPESVADALDASVTAGALVVVSTDLSHYLDHATATRRDRATAEAVVRRDAGAVGSRDACGAAPLRGLLVWARRHDLSVRLLDLRTSADTAGGRGRVVGYGAFRVDPA